MLSVELKQRLRSLVEKYEQRRSNVIWALDRFPYRKIPHEKPRIRIKAGSRRVPPISR